MGVKSCASVFFLEGISYSVVQTPLLWDSQWQCI